jgi:hypothetical protein
MKAIDAFCGKSLSGNKYMITDKSSLLQREPQLAVMYAIKEQPVHEEKGRL